MQISEFIGKQIRENGMCSVKKLRAAGGIYNIKQ